MNSDFRYADRDLITANTITASRISFVEPGVEKMYNTFILIDATGYGHKVAIPFSVQVLDALTNARIIQNEYNAKTNEYELFTTNKNLEIKIAKINEFKKAPPSEAEEIEKLEEERAKLFQAAEQLNQEINAKRNK